jgi:hypothetical protein
MNVSSDTGRAPEIARLRSTAAVRERCTMVYQ